MDRLAPYVRTLCVAFAFVAAGCAHQALDLRALDVERLNNAIAIDDVGYVRAAIESGAVGVNQRVPASAYMEGTPLLTIAARAGSLEVMRYLLSAGADVNARTPAGETALMLASYFGQGSDAGGRHEAAVRMLVEAGADVENEPHHYTPLAYAAYQGHDRIVRYLLERGARVDGDADSRGGYTYVNTPLMMAAIQGHHSTARSLLRAGANPRIRVHQGHTATEFAQKYNHPALFDMLRCAENTGAAPMVLASCR